MKRPLRILVDTGAQINILPLVTYLRIPEAHRPKIKKINHRIKLGDDGFMDAKGIVTVKLTIAKEQYEGRFYVTSLGSQVVLGTSFMKDY